MSKFDRRGFIKLAGLGGGIVFASSLGRGLGLNPLGSVVDYANAKVENDFYFVQLSDTHWGFAGPKVNPDAEGTLKKAVQAVTASNSNRTSLSLPAISHTPLTTCRSAEIGCRSSKKLSVG
jgi:hypothetical protein